MLRMVDVADQLCTACLIVVVVLMVVVVVVVDVWQSAQVKSEE
jgi:hypothetical protein